MPDPAPLLGPVQRRLIGFALGLFAFLAIGVLLAGIVIGLSSALGYFSNVLWPLAAAGIVALILRPVVDAVERRLKGRRLPAVVLLFGVVVLAVAGFLVLVTPRLLGEAREFAATLPQLWEQIWNWIQVRAPEWIAFANKQMENPAIKELTESLAVKLKALPDKLLPAALGAFGQIRSAIGFVVGLSLVPVYLFFFLLSRNDAFGSLRSLLSFLRDDWRDDVVFLVREFVGIVVAFFRGQLLIGLIMGTLYGIGFTLAGLRFGLVIGLAMGLLNIVPYLGTILGLSVALPLGFFQSDGGLRLVVITLVVFAAVQAAEGWFLTPRIMGKQTGLHPVAIIFSVLFWGTALGGILGMVLAIPLSAFFVTAWRLLKHKYIAPALGSAGPVAAPDVPPA